MLGHLSLVPDRKFIIWTDAISIRSFTLTICKNLVFVKAANKQMPL